MKRYSWQGTVASVLSLVVLAFTYAHPMSADTKDILVAIIICSILIVLAVRLE